NAGATCRAAAGVCDIAETCTGTSTVCPSDVFEPTTTECRGAVDECDASESCPGNGPNCPADARKPAGTSCTDEGNARTTGRCDAPSADGQHAAGNAGATCRAASAVCDVAETCTGASTVCPADAFEASTTTCRLSAGECDPAENCTGSGPACPV